jgi:hypothetical protein
MRHAKHARGARMKYSLAATAVSFINGHRQILSAKKQLTLKPYLCTPIDLIIPQAQPMLLKQWQWNTPPAPR